MQQQQQQNQQKVKRRVKRCEKVVKATAVSRLPQYANTLRPHAIEAVPVLATKHCNNNKREKSATVEYSGKVLV